MVNSDSTDFSLSACQVVASINTDTGGPAYSVTALAEYLAEAGVDSHLFTLDYQRHGPQKVLHNAHLHCLLADTPARWLRGFSVDACDTLGRIAGRKTHSGTHRMDIIHNHGLWMFPNYYARIVADRADVPLLISPRGMLEPWSLKRSSLRKKLAWFAFERKNLASAACFHATSIEEAQSIRSAGFEQPVAVIPNGVDLPSPEMHCDRAELEARFPELTGKRWLLFLSRLHPKKGIDLLLQAWTELQSGFPEWQLVLAGPDLTGYKPYLERLIDKLDLTDRVTFTGALSGQQRLSALKNAQLFILPSHSENYGLVVAEALSFGTPVITTKGTPWRELQAEACGWQIELTTDNLKRTLFSALSLSDEDRMKMGSAGEVLIRRSYTWPGIAQQMKELYLWLIGKSDPPECLFWEEREQ